MQALADISLHAAADELLAVVGTQRVWQVDAAGADLRSADAGRGLDRVYASRADAPARPAAALAERPGQRRARAANRTHPARAGARAGGRPVRGAGPRGVRAGPSVRALGRNAPTGRVRAHAALGQAAAVPGRALRRAGRDHPRGDAHLADGRPRTRAADGGAGDARRRGGDRAGRPRRGALAAPRTGRGGAGGGPRAPARAHRSRGGGAARAGADRPAREGDRDEAPNHRGAAGDGTRARRGSAHGRPTSTPAG